MPHYNEYRCSVCRNHCSPELLTTKSIVFKEMKPPKKTKRSRVVLWLCRACLGLDPDFAVDAYSSPGHTSTALERVKANDVER